MFKYFTYIRTCIYNWSLQHFNQDYDLASPITALILYMSGGTYSLKSTPNDKIFEKLCRAILFTLRVLLI